MYEFSIACKYLLPRWKQLSVSVISLISILVIALVVWLIVVFFSVTQGLEKSWIQKLVAITAPIRLIPTKNYYRSYYYLVDGLSSSSDYTYKSIGEKRFAQQTDPYDPLIDEEIPSDWPLPDKWEEQVVDLVKETFKVLEGFNDIQHFFAQDYEIAFADLHLESSKQDQSEFFLPLYLTNLDPNNSALSIALSSIQELDIDKGVLLPKSLKEAGIEVGNQGWLAYQAATTSAVQEQRLPIIVQGFYDPGILPLGGKFVLAPSKLVSGIRSAQTHTDIPHSTNGIGIHFEDVMQAEAIKQRIVAALKEHNLDPYWSVESFRDFPSTRDLLQQLGSERTLFTLIAVIVIIVACSNIVSLLIILVNDKKEEIGILRAMGASTWSIALIFGMCGIVMGGLGSLAGILFALLTLSHLERLVSFISSLQGHQLLNPLFYGDQLPNQFSQEALLFVITTTAFISMIAGIIPALKACWMQPSQLLRTE